MGQSCPRIRELEIGSEGIHSQVESQVETREPT
jgi:hypothetical protein